MLRGFAQIAALRQPAQAVRPICRIGWKIRD
jgi:hypothetical protein